MSVSEKDFLLQLRLENLSAAIHKHHHECTLCMYPSIGITCKRGIELAEELEALVGRRQETDRV